MFGTANGRNVFVCFAHFPQRFYKFVFSTYFKNVFFRHMLIKKYAFYTLVLLIISLPFELIFSTIAMVIWIAFSVLALRLKDLSIPNFHNSYLLIFYFLLVAIGVMYSEKAIDAIDRVVRQLPFLLFPLAALTMSIGQEEKDKLKKAFILACTLFCLISLGTLLYNVWVNYSTSHHYNFVQSSMYHFHFPYDTLYLNIAYVFLLFGNFNEWIKKGISLLFFVVIFLFGVRIGIATFLMITALYMVLNFKKILLLRNIVLVVAVTLAAIFIINKSTYLKDKYLGVLEKVGVVSSEKISKVGKDYHKLTLRNQLWTGSWDAIKQRPMFGYGTYGEVDHLKESYSNNGLEPKNRNLNSHNQYLSTVLQHGLIGGVLLVFILLRSLYLSVRTKNLEGILFVTVFGIAFITESILIRQKGIMLFALFIVLLINEPPKKKEGTGTRTLTT